MSSTVNILAMGFVMGISVGIVIGHWMRGLEHGWRTLIGTSYINRLKRPDETHTEWQERISK